MRLLDQAIVRYELKQLALIERLIKVMPHFYLSAHHLERQRQDFISVHAIKDRLKNLQVQQHSLREQVEPSQPFELVI